MLDKKHTLVIHRIILDAASGTNPGQMSRACVAVAETLEVPLSDVAFRFNDMLYGVSLEVKELELRNLSGKK